MLKGEDFEERKRIPEEKKKKVVPPSLNGKKKKKKRKEFQKGERHVFCFSINGDAPGGRGEKERGWRREGRKGGGASSSPPDYERC